MSNLLNDDLNQSRQEIIGTLNLDIDQFLADISQQRSSELNDWQKWITCRSLLGDTPKEIAVKEQELLNKSSVSNSKDISTPIRNELRRVYDLIPYLLNTEEKLNNWLKILNLLLKSSYKLAPPILNENNFQASFGNQLFLVARHPEILGTRSRATDFYQKGLYYQAFSCFKTAWHLERSLLQEGNPETLIYLNNSWLEHNQDVLKKQGITLCTIAVVIPVYHNFGRVAKELLRGIAQLQLMINLLIDSSRLPCSLQKTLEINEKPLSLITSNKVALKILIVNENNNVYAAENKTAKYLASIAKDLGIMGVIGHYSSEMTKKAVKIYADQGLLLITPSSTSNELSKLIEQSSLLRMTTPDWMAAKTIVNYLANRFETEKSPLISILYNENSIYSCSLRESIREIASNYSQLNLVPETEECSYIHEDYHRIQDYLEQHSEIGILIVIPDGGIEPNSLKNSGLITRFCQNRLIIGSATLYHQNLLDGLEIEDPKSLEHQIVMCIPWHEQSLTNGKNGQNLLSQRFCQMGEQLWGTEKVTWRSATSFDCGLIIVKSLEQNPTTTPQKLLENINIFYRENKKFERGVTGKIEFGDNCDRLEPPTELVTITWQESSKKWIFIPIS